VLPNFIIAEAQKAGTTALHLYLGQHPDIFMAKKSQYLFWYDTEIHFFDKNFEFIDLRRKHVGSIPRSKFLTTLLGTEIIKKNKLLRKSIMKINTKKGKIPPMKAETRKYLEQYFEEYNKKLKKITELDLSIWRNKK